MKLVVEDELGLIAIAESGVTEIQGFFVCAE